MSTTYAEALGALTPGAAIARDDVRRWIDSGDLLTWSIVYTLLETESGRFDEELPAEEQVEFMRRYLLRCLEENPTPGEHLHGGYEAAWELAAALKKWRLGGPRITAIVRGIAVALEKTYRRADSATQNRILCGVMEHAFEDPGLRVYFANWERDPELREVYHTALEWGATHED